MYFYAFLCIFIAYYARFPGADSGAQVEGPAGAKREGDSTDPRERRRRRRAEPRETRAPEAAPGGRIKKGGA